MSHTNLTPVFTGMRTGLHVLVATLLALVVARVVIVQPPNTWAPLVIAALFAAIYSLGGRVQAGAQGRRAPGLLWIAALSVLWIALVALVPEAAYLVFPMFFLYLHVVRGAAGPALVVTATIVAILAIALHSKFTVGGVIGPLVGAGVALLIGLGYRALAAESAEREALLAELVATRDLLAATEREQGILAERSRLAREIHDTVAQGLSSIQMLLHAAEREGATGPALDHLRLARTTAGEGLAEARRFIRELTPPTLDGGLGPALRRLAAGARTGDGLRIEVAAPDAVDLPMAAQTALLRVAQGAVANVVKHAGAGAARIDLSLDDRSATLTVSDDGVGFDPGAVRGSSSDSFGLRAIRERIDQLGGDLRLTSVPGQGTVLVVTLHRIPA